jgi:DNA (cytosine-5)-methyltransferase 1
MKYLSLCSGIEAATVAWHPLGWEAVAYSEIERFPSEVLAHHYPQTPNLGDMTKFKEWTNVSNVDVLVGGTPCQSFSVAGLRKGLDDPRGNLMLTYLAIAAKYRPKWLVWENVPGVLSSNGGLDFASLLRGMGELGYGFAYRILDAQYFGVAQRRRRVFVVGYLGNWRPAAAVLFERHSLCGYPAPSREKREGFAASTIPSVAGSLDTECGGGKLTHQSVANGHLLQTTAFYESSLAQYKQADVSGTAKASGGVAGGGSETFIAQPVYEMHGQDSRVRELGDVCTTVSATYGTGGGNVPVTIQAIALAENTIGRQPQNGGNGDGFTDGGPMYTLNATGVHGVAQPIAFKETADCLTAAYGTNWNGNAGADNGSLFVGQPCYPISTQNALGRVNGRDDWPLGLGDDGDPAPTLTKSHGQGVAQGMAVRRLTPVECERLQGFGDNYTDIKSKNKPTPDGPRYKALGNSMAVPVMAWIGQRIEQVEAICKQNK